MVVRATEPSSAFLGVRLGVFFDPFLITDFFAGLLGVKFFKAFEVDLVTAFSACFFAAFPPTTLPLEIAFYGEVLDFRRGMVFVVPQGNCHSSP